MFKQFICAIVSAAAFASPTLGRELFVNNQAGDDRNNGRLPQSTMGGGPVRSVGRALAIASPGDHIVIANTGEPYYEHVSLSTANHSGISAQPMIIQGNGAVLDGSLPVSPDAWEPTSDLFRFRPPNGGFHQLFLGGKPLERIAVEPTAGQLPQLAPGQWCSHQGYIWFFPGPGKLPRDLDLRYAARPVGITLYHVHDVQIVDLIVQGYRIDGVSAHDGCRDIRLGGLILRGNGRSGLAVGGSSQVSADGCTMGDNRTAQVHLSGWSTLSMQLCELLEATAPKMIRTGGRLQIDGAIQ